MPAEGRNAAYDWPSVANAAPGFYMNTADPGSQSTHWTTPGPKSCGGKLR